MLNWKQAHNINKNQKYKKTTLPSKRKSRSKNKERENNKILYSGKKKASVHVLDDVLYNKIKFTFGLVRSDFHRVLNKKIIWWIIIRIIGTMRETGHGIPFLNS